MSTSNGLFDKISALVVEVEGVKTAAATDKTAMDDPGGHEGPTTHPSKKPDDNEQASNEGAQSADNTKVVKESVPESVDSQPEATPGNVPDSDEVQLGQGVDKAKATGEDSKTESDFKGKPDGDKQQGDMGGTTHVADGQYGDKFAAEKLAAASDDELCKMAADLGNEIVADIANGHFDSEAPAAPASAHKTAADNAAAAGATIAEQAAEFDPTKAAANVISGVVKVAHHQADLVASHLKAEAAEVNKQAAEELQDPTAGGAEGEDHGSEEGAPMPGGGGGSAEELLAQMGGDPGMGGGPEMGGDPAMGGMEEPGLGAPPDAMGEMGPDEGIQQLAMALLELGIDPAELAAAAADTGAKIAAEVQKHKRAGKFRMEEAKTAGQRDARNYMKGYVKELMQRSRR